MSSDEKKYSVARRQSGFSLVEMLVVIAIMGFISSVMLWRNSQFNSTITLSNLAHETAIAIREAQVYGISVGSQSPSDFEAAYGVQIDLDTPNQFRLFRDENNDSEFSEGDDFVLETFRFRGGVEIDRFCVTKNGGSEQCAPQANLRELNLVFKRPNPNAAISTNTNGWCSSDCESATVFLQSTSGDERSVLVTSTGQVSVSTPEE